MPRLFHKNRSNHSLLNSQEVDERNRYQPSPADSPLHSPAYPPSHHEEEKDEEEELDDYGHPYRRQENLSYQANPPTRSQSHRNPGPINTNVPQPTINLVGPAHSTPSSAIGENTPDSFYRQGPAYNSPAQKEDRRKRRFFGLGGSSKDSINSPAPSNKLGRSISVRRREHIPESRHYPTQPEYPSTHVSPGDDYEDDGDQGAGVHHSDYRTDPPSDKEPLRSPGLPPTISRQDYSFRGTNTSPTQTRRSPSDREGSSGSSWARASSSVHHHTVSEAGQQQVPQSATSTVSSQHLSHRSPSDTLHEPWQDEIPSRPSSQQSLEPPPANYIPRSHHSHHVRNSSSQASSLSHYTQNSMVHQPSPQGPVRRTSEVQEQPAEQGRGSGYQPYAQGSQDRGVLPSNAPPPPPYSSQLTPQNQAYRNSQVSTMQQSGHEPGRSTPPPNRSRDDLSNMDYSQLQASHDALQEKYRKVKKYYFDKDAQVQQLQNTLAHQRLSQSRTSLDDNEYANRFSRLDGAINNLAFNLRRDWRQVPPWLAPHVNRDACTSMTKEMTAVGRASISRWLVDELLERYFHPGLEPALSAQLKIIEKNLRRLASPTPTDEEKEMLVGRISSWRLCTLDGLQEVLAAPQAAENRAALTEMLIEKLVSSLGGLLKDPSSPGVEGGVAMIVELAVGISANLPLESRDVFVEYVHPGQPINETYMKVETGLPALTNPGDNPAEGETASLTSRQTEDDGSIDSREAGNSNGNNAVEEKGEGPQQQAQGGKKKGMFGSFMGGGGGGGTIKKGSVASTTSSIAAGVGAQGPASGEKKEDRVRFSTFMAAQVRGRNVLVKAPVYVRD